MQGIGPMPPVRAVAYNIESSSTKSSGIYKQELGTGSHDELAIVRQTSTARTGSTLLESGDECSVNEPAKVAHQQRDLSLITDFDLVRATKQLKNGEISDLELSLFAFWIKSSDSNYVKAKALVRELALDRGYNINKITNQHVRRLLQEVNDIRPRDPRRASTRDSTFRDQTHLSGVQNSNGIRAVTSPLTARIDILPPWLRLKRERAVREAAQPTLSASSIVNYPPNSPDRPAPLSVKSRSSQISSSTPMRRETSRSVSTPVRMRTKEDPTPLPEKPLDPLAGSTRTLHFSHASATAEYSGNIFGDLQCKPTINANLFTAQLDHNGDRRHGDPKKYTQNEFANLPQLGQCQLDASDVTSSSSCETCCSIIRKGQECASESATYEGGIIGDDTFDSLAPYVAAEDEDEDECSSLESAKTNNSEERQTLCYFAPEAPLSRSKTVAPGPGPTSSKRRAASRSHCKSQGRSLNSPMVSFHQSLPLRNYESEVTMVLAADAKAYSGRNKTKSVTSIINSTQGTTKTMQYPPLSALSRVHSGIHHTEQKISHRDSSNNKISEHIDQHLTLPSRSLSDASTLASFPIPPMGNPVGELPMLVSRATTSSSALQSASSQRLAGVASLEEMYRAITKVNMTAVLQRTRARGEQLQLVNWDDLSSFEQAWRKVNEVLLVTIYGRQDVFLDASDVSYIDCVARELRKAPNDADPMTWVCRMFENGV
ncbi:hypothetical protein SVAN01_03584 [Stagonosporopsis vannaccii]|nr:hypothetical protein SVAN01_03584 [Stagonosporopsis vannaccii]